MTLPTPFSADEIRSGCPDRRTVRTRDASGTVSVSRFLDGDGEPECIRYDVGDMTFWFDRHRPGMPVRYGNDGSLRTMVSDARE